MYEGILRVVSPQMDVVLEVAHIKTDFSTVHNAILYTVSEVREDRKLYVKYYILYTVSGVS